MCKFDPIVSGGTIATASDVLRADLGVRDGRIVQIGENLGKADVVVEASGKFVLTGGIDSHVPFLPALR